MRRSLGPLFATFIAAAAPVVARAQAINPSAAIVQFNPYGFCAGNKYTGADVFHLTFPGNYEGDIIAVRWKDGQIVVGDNIARLPEALQNQVLASQFDLIGKQLADQDRRCAAKPGTPVPYHAPNDGSSVKPT